LASRGSILLVFFMLLPVSVQGHNMGKPVPIGYTGSDLPQAHLAAQVVACYFGEQLGREVELVRSDSLARCVEWVRNREFPMAVVPAGAAEDLPEGVRMLGGVLGAPGRSFVLVMGSDARQKLEFSLVQRYMDTLSGRLGPADWEKADERVQAGEGVRGVALDMLREKDLI